MASGNIFVCYCFVCFLSYFCSGFDGKHYRDKAKKQRRAYSFVMRGNIYDRNGIKLVTDTVYYDIFARRDDFVHTPEELAELLSPILNIPYVSLVEKNLNKKDPLISLKKMWIDKPVIRLQS